ncbi:conserved hypothetical protein [Thermoanaerobacterium thermosaccharolyticum DSM 571]|uniref:Alkaline phosphatase n=1 Tax=Thermoanaerobacterium thermosaccharolyticum (strain ATCC 7956 / DSM 571 / NCIMB 9385 / NCA 3814 / NCTC 13789 / WDCM 00135 / 2032) TaxID=580327 RepID=D9TND0_THETC|nr:hypothetical protein [Thermoanaerobacterium thermosaccharolyticum]ADL67673.1 conserved hypothetical protein [Thermoanaerobacterium thermosaccharolyticum DSM 571]
MKKFITAFMLLLMTLTFMLPQKSYADTSNNKKVVLVIIDRVSLSDYTKYDAKNIQKLINNGSVGLMNVRNADGYVDASGYLTFGTGTRASAHDIGQISLNVNEKYSFGTAGEIYELNTGDDYGNANIVNIGISNLIQSSKRADYKITPGLLGQLLKDNNIPTYVFGNSDIITDSSVSYRRYGALIAMDEKGTAFGDVSENVLKYDRNSPYFISTDYNKIFDYFQKYDKNGGFFVIDTGDTSRVDSYSSNVSDQLASKYEEYAIKNADAFIGKLLKNLDPSRDLLIVATPYPSKSDMSTNNLLSPIIIYGPGYNGLTTSITTKRNGIITNLDLAPTILNYFGIKAPVEMLGHPITNIKTQDKVNYLENLNDKVVSIYTARPIVLKSYVIFLIIILILYLITLFLKINYLKYLKPIVLGVMIVPLSLLILSLFGPLTVYSSMIALILITIALLLIIKLFAKNELNMLIVISLLTALTITVDIFTGAHLMKGSILGYDVIAGARFYGIGNEYMGVLIGSTIMGVMALIQKYDNKATKFSGVLFFALVFLLMVLPQYGAKIGGFITGFMAFGVTLLLMSEIKINYKNLLILFISMVLLLTLMFIASMFMDTVTHMAQTALIVKNEGITALYKIFARKLNMELTLIRYTIWSWVLIITIMSLFILSYKPTGILKSIFKKNKYIYYGFFGSIVGMLFALAFNDAGIVAASTMCIYAFPPILIMLEGEIRKSEI